MILWPSFPFCKFLIGHELEFKRQTQLIQKLENYIIILVLQQLEAMQQNVNFKQNFLLPSRMRISAALAQFDF